MRIGRYNTHYTKHEYGLFWTWKITKSSFMELENDYFHLLHDGTGELHGLFDGTFYVFFFLNSADWFIVPLKHIITNNLLNSIICASPKKFWMATAADGKTEKVKCARNLLCEGHEEYGRERKKKEQKIMYRTRGLLNLFHIYVNLFSIQRYTENNLKLPRRRTVTLNNVHWS